MKMKIQKLNTAVLLGVMVATTMTSFGINAAENAALLAIQMLATGDEELYAKLEAYKESLKEKVVKANQELASVKFVHKTN